MQEAAGNSSLLWSPLTFALLVGVAIVLIWQALAPARRRQLDTRLQDYVQQDQAQADELDRPFAQRVLAPGLHGVLRILGGLLPKRNTEKLRKLLIYAGEPGGFSALDFMGLRLVTAFVVGCGCFWFYARYQPQTPCSVRRPRRFFGLYAALAVAARAGEAAADGDPAGAARCARHADHHGRGGAGL